MGDPTQNELTLKVGGAEFKRFLLCPGMDVELVLPVRIVGSLAMVSLVRRVPRGLPGWKSSWFSLIDDCLLHAHSHSFGCFPCSFFVI